MIQNCQHFSLFTDGNRAQKVILFKILRTICSPRVIAMSLVRCKTLSERICYLNLFENLAVDWEELASNNFYMVPARQTREVGSYTAELIDYLVSKQGADLNSFHLIGHSLGAHTVGYAGAFTKSGKIPRITGKVQ